MRASWMAPWVLGLAVGCGGGGGAGGGGALDCAWLAGDNCWKQTLVAAQACLPPSTASGTLSADNATCTYVSGEVITFTPPLVLPLPNDPTWHFTIDKGGQPCLSFESTTGFKLTVMGQTVTESAAGLGLAVTCPDGSRFSNSNAFPLLMCPTDGGGIGLPGTFWSDTATRVSLGLLGSASGVVDLFDCSK